MPIDAIAQPHSHEVQSLIAQDLVAATQLLELLGTENDALISRNRERVSEILTRKQELMLALEKHARTRESWLLQSYPQLHNASHEEKTPHWEEFLTFQGGPALLQQWRNLRDTLQQCKTVNEKNGKVIARSRQTVAQLLDIFRGKNTNAPKLYTAKGRANVHSYSQTVTKA